MVYYYYGFILVAQALGSFSHYYVVLHEVIALRSQNAITLVILQYKIGYK